MTATSGRLGPVDDGGVGRGERVEDVARAEGFRIEHITSGIVDTPVEFIQAHDEWVVVLAGLARLEVGGAEHVLGPGDWILIPASSAHRLMSVEPGTEWIAVHDRPEGRAP